jgi:hypothetical protein
LEDGAKIRVEETNEPAGSPGALGRGNRRGNGGATNQTPANQQPKPTGA